MFNYNSNNKSKENQTNNNIENILLNNKNDN